MVGAALGVPEFPAHLPAPSGPIVVAWLEPSEQAWLLVIPTKDPQLFLRALQAEPSKRRKKPIRGRAKLLPAPAMPEARWWTKPGHVLGAATAAHATRAQVELKQGNLRDISDLDRMHQALAFGAEISGFVNVQEGGAYPVDKLAFGVSLRGEHVLIRAVVGTTTSAIARPRRPLAELPLVDTATVSLFVSVATAGARAADIAQARLGWRSARFDRGLLAPPWSASGNAALDGHFVEATAAHGATVVALGLRPGASASTATAATESAGARDRASIDRNAIVLGAQRKPKAPPFWATWPASQRRLLPTNPVAVLVVSNLRPPIERSLIGLQAMLGSHIGLGGLFGSTPATKKLQARLQERAGEAGDLGSKLNRARRQGRNSAVDALGLVVLCGAAQDGWLVLEGGFALPNAPDIAVANAQRALLSGRPSREALLALQEAKHSVAGLEKQLERARGRAMKKMFGGSLSGAMSGEMFGNRLGSLGDLGGGVVGSSGLGLGGMGSGGGGGGTGFGRLGGLGKRVRSPRLTLERGGPPELQAFVKRKLRRLKYCYRSSKVSTDDLKGDLKIELSVDGDTRVLPGAATGPAAAHISVCLKRALRGRLPGSNPQSGTVRLRYARP